jgi:uncharacterized protein involved in exopolysaccharide biosynthesis
VVSLLLLAGAADRARAGGAGNDKEDAAARKEAERLRAENEALRSRIKLLERKLLKLTAEQARLRDELNQTTLERDAGLARTEALLERLRKLEREKVRPPAAPGPPARVRGKLNPPDKPIEGRVEKVNKAGDKTLVVISVGSDAGLVVGHTLDVYRLRPQAQYLGVVRIVQVEARTAVGQLLPARGKQPEVRPGDRVASSIQPPR